MEQVELQYPKSKDNCVKITEESDK